jgi:hypothetical protein
LLPDPLVLLTPVANLPPVSTIPAEKFAADVNDSGGKLPPVSTTLVAKNGNNIRLLIPESELEGKNFLYYPKVTKQNY